MLAKEISLALLQRDPNDVRALIILSRAERDFGNYEQAKDYGKRAWAHAETDVLKFAAALATAQALSSDGARTSSQFWLRRAADVAPDQRLKSIAIRDFRYVRDRNPWTTQFEFGITPSSNVNNGSKSETMEIDGLPYVLSGDARALSGVEYKLGVETEYSRKISEYTWLYVGASAKGKEYSLSSKAVEQAPNIDESELSYAEAELTFGTTFFPHPNGGPIDASMSFGRVWSGGQELSDYARANLQHFKRVGPHRFTFGLSVEDQRRKDAEINSSVSWTGQAVWSKRLENGDTAQLNLAYRDTQSDGPAIAHEAGIAGIRYSFGKPIAGARIGLSYTFESRAYDQPLYSTTPREDKKNIFEVSAFLYNLELYGFAPEIGVSLIQNRSNVPLYETEEYGVSINFKSVF